jgi:hypothetical protein
LVKLVKTCPPVLKKATLSFYNLQLQLTTVHETHAPEDPIDHLLRERGGCPQVVAETFAGFLSLNVWCKVEKADRKNNSAKKYQ